MIDRSRIYDLAHRFSGDDEPYAYPKRCDAYPTETHNLAYSLEELRCSEDLQGGRHDGPHHNKAGMSWEQKRRLSPIERVPEGRYG